MKCEYFQKQHEDHGENLFYEVLLPDLLLFAIVISTSLAMLIFMFRTFG